MRNSVVWGTLAVIAAPALAQTAPPAEIAAEGVDAIPAEVVEGTKPYLEYRTAAFQGWNPTTRAMLILTRFGETNQMHEVRAPGAARTQISFESERIDAAGYGPVDARILLAAQDVGGAEKFQIYRFERGRRTLLTDGTSRNTDVVFSHDGALIGYTSTRRDGRSADIWVMDPRNPASARMVRAMEGNGWRLLDIASDNLSAIVQHYRTDTDAAIFRLSLADGAITPLIPADAPVAVTMARYGAGGVLYAISDAGSDVRRLVAFDPEGVPRPVSPPLPWDVESFDVSPDGKLIAYAVNEAGISRLRLREVKRGRERTVDLPAGVISGLDIAPWGEIGFTLSSSRAPGDTYSVDPKTLAVKRWTFSEAGGLDTSRLALPELVKTRSFDGLEISGFLYRPDPVRFPGRRPVIVSLHGGPAAQSRPNFLGRDSYFVEEMGVALFKPNVRGSTGYGKRFVALDDGMKRADSLKDLGAFLTALRTDPRLDGERIGLSGGSYSGYLVLGGLIDYGAAVRGGMSVSGISDFSSFLANTSGYRQDYRRAEYGDERDPAMRAYLDSISPIRGVDRIADPVFVASGANDPRVPPSEAGRIADAVRRNGGTVWSLVAANEGHGYARKANRDYLFRASVLFWRRTLFDGTGR